MMLSLAKSKRMFVNNDITSNEINLKLVNVSSRKFFIQLKTVGYMTLWDCTKVSADWTTDAHDGDVDRLA